MLFGLWVGESQPLSKSFLLSDLNNSYNVLTHGNLGMTRWQLLSNLGKTKVMKMYPSWICTHTSDAFFGFWSFSVWESFSRHPLRSFFRCRRKPCYAAFFCTWPFFNRNSSIVRRWALIGAAAAVSVATKMPSRSEDILKGFRLNWMNLRDADTGKILWQVISTGAWTSLVECNFPLFTARAMTTSQSPAWSTRPGCPRRYSSAERSAERSTSPPSNL